MTVSVFHNLPFFTPTTRTPAINTQDGQSTFFSFQLLVLKLPTQIHFDNQNSLNIIFGSNLLYLLSWLKPLVILKSLLLWEYFFPQYYFASKAYFSCKEFNLSKYPVVIYSICSYFLPTPYLVFSLIALFSKTLFNIELQAALHTDIYQLPNLFLLITTTF